MEGCGTRWEEERWLDGGVGGWGGGARVILTKDTRKRCARRRGAVMFDLSLDHLGPCAGSIISRSNSTLLIRPPGFSPSLNFHLSCPQLLLVSAISSVNSKPIDAHWPAIPDDPRRSETIRDDPRRSERTQDMMLPVYFCHLDFFCFFFFVCCWKGKEEERKRGRID